MVRALDLNIISLPDVTVGGSGFVCVSLSPDASNKRNPPCCSEGIGELIETKFLLGKNQLYCGSNDSTNT